MLGEKESRVRLPAQVNYSDRLSCPPSLLFNEHRRFFLGESSGQGAKLTTQHLVTRLILSELMLLIPVHAFMAFTGTTFPFTNKQHLYILCNVLPDMCLSTLKFKSPSVPIYAILTYMSLSLALLSHKIPGSIFTPDAIHAGTILTLFSVPLAILQTQS
jgi:hypothetical protein